MVTAGEPGDVASASSTAEPPKQLHIVYVWDAEYPWDIRTEKTCSALTNAGHDVHIVARNRNRDSTTERRPEATVHRMYPWKFLGPKFDGALSFPAFLSPRWHSLIRETAVSQNADLIIARDLPLCPTAISVGRQLKVPVILDMAEHYPAMMRALWDTNRQGHLDWLVRNPRIVESVERYCIRNVQHIFTVAREMTERLEALGIHSSRITEVANTPPISIHRSIPKLLRRDTESMVVVYLGLMEVVRGVSDVIDAIALLRERGHEISLRLIGSGRDEQLFRARARAKGLASGDVEFKGYVPYERAVELLAGADVGVLPLHKNDHMDTTAPNKLFDYMNAGLPVITSDTVPSARIITEEDAGVVFAARNVVELADAILSLQNVDTRRRMGDHGRRAIARRYNWSLDASRLLAAAVTVESEYRKHL